MRTFYRVTLPLLMIVLVTHGYASRPVSVHAQDSGMMDRQAIACDSTLVLLLLVAEHDYGYLSEMQTLPNVDLGQYAPLIQQVIAMKQTTETSAEEMAAMQGRQRLIDSMMSMSTNDLLAQDRSMGIDATGGTGIILAEGAILGENEVCTSVRADVEKFLTAHILVDMATGSAPSSK